MLRAIAQNCTAMPVTLSEIKVVGVEGLKSTAKFGMKDIARVDGDEFLSIAPYNYTFVTLVCESNPAAPSVREKYFSLTRSKGLAIMKKLRNDAQATIMSSDAASSCSLFENADTHAQKRARLTRTEMNQRYRDHAIVSIDVPVDGTTVAVRVLRPVHPNDVLAVEYTEDAIDAVIKCIRAEGFLDQMKLATTAQPGIWHRKGFVLATIKQDDGHITSKKCLTGEEAVAVQAAMLDQYNAQRDSLAMQEGMIADCVVADQPVGVEEALGAERHAHIHEGFECEGSLDADIGDLACGQVEGEQANDAARDDPTHDALDGEEAKDAGIEQ